jgi:hypothetical protein
MDLVVKFDGLLILAIIIVLSLTQGVSGISYHLPQQISIPNEALTGVWLCDDGGQYLIRHIGDDVWWYGLSKKKGWSNIYHGTIYHPTNSIDGKWLDVPYLSYGNNGELTIEIDPSLTQLKAIGKTGGFGGSVWNKCPQVEAGRCKPGTL